MKREEEGEEILEDEFLFLLAKEVTEVENRRVKTKMNQKLNWSNQH